MQDFGLWVRQSREARRMTQTECAARAGMHLQQWNRMEKSARSPQAQTIRSVATGLQMDEDEVFAAVGFTGRNAPDVELQRLLMGLTPEQTRIVLNVARATRESLLTA